MTSRSNINSISPITTVAYIVALAAGMPGVLAATPAARWGHQAVYVKSKLAMYVVGGEVPTSSSQITNDVLILPLNSSNPSFTVGDSTGLPPHAFASLATTANGGSLVLTGGMTSSCSSDGTTHTLDLSGDEGGGWTSTTPSRFVRRRGAGAAWVDDGSAAGKVLVVGGIADTYSCASSTYAFPATDVLALPLSSSSLVSTRNLPSSLTGTNQAVSDFAFTTGSDGKVYLTGGQSASGQFVDMSTVGIWDSANGWSSQDTSGDVPSGRVGASLVAHPSLDLLVLLGGSTDTSGTASNLLSFLNTTSWTWSTPSNLQPPASSAASYHTSVMTEQGVMITAFGLASSGQPRSDVYYLDMRDPTQSGWTWKSSWNSNMLSEYTTSGSNDGTSTTTGTVNTAKDAAQSEDGMSSKKIASITAPILIFALLLSPIIIYLVRRRMRVIKKRRMARHFSFSSQEDEGGFSSNPFQQYLAKRRTKTQFPFGRDANEKEGNFFSDMSGGLSRMITRLSDRSNSEDGHGDIDQQREREMIEVHRSPKLRFNDRNGNGNGSGSARDQPMNWEEIDFGLGKLDESKHLDPSLETLQHQQTHSSPFGDHAAIPMPMSMSGHPAGPASTSGYAPEMLYNDDNVAPHYVGRLNQPNPEFNVSAPVEEAHGSIIPYLMVQPATAPATPATTTLSSAYPAMVPTPASAVGGQTPADGLDWNKLQQSLETKPAFRSISPTAQLRSHAHSQVQAQAAVHRSESPRPASPAPSLPALDFETSHNQSHRRPSSASSTSSTGTIHLVDSRLNLGHGRRPEFLPFSNLTHDKNASRSVSQPIGRQLAGNLNRRGSAPYASDPPLSSGQTTPTAGARPISHSFTPGMRRSASSNLPSPAGAPGIGSPVALEKRASMLRVVNVTESTEDEAK